ncbi:MerR family transcriptional regulator [Pseudarthrobacter sp. NPDC089323]
MKIGDLAERTGVSTRMLRYYEDQGLLHPERLSNGYRDYPEDSITRVQQIRDLLMAGLSTETIEEMVPCFTGSGDEFRPMVSPALAANLQRELERIEQRIETLERNGTVIRNFLDQARSTGIATGTQSPT